MRTLLVLVMLLGVPMPVSAWAQPAATDVGKPLREALLAAEDPKFPWDLAELDGVIAFAEGLRPGSTSDAAFIRAAAGSGLAPITAFVTDEQRAIARLAWRDGIVFYLEAPWASSASERRARHAAASAANDAMHEAIGPPPDLEFPLALANQRYFSGLAWDKAASAELLAKFQARAEGIVERASEADGDPDGVRGLITDWHRLMVSWEVAHSTEAKASDALREARAAWEARPDRRDVEFAQRERAVSRQWEAFNVEPGRRDRSPDDAAVTAWWSAALADGETRDDALRVLRGSGDRIVASPREESGLDAVPSGQRDGDREPRPASEAGSQDERAAALMSTASSGRSSLFFAAVGVLLVLVGVVVFRLRRV